MSIPIEAIEKYLVPDLKAKWTSIQSTNRPDGRRFPLAVEEAAFNTTLTASIYRVLVDRGDYSSALVSEAKVKRTGTDNGRCDIILLSEEIAYYIELKSVFLYGYESPTQTIRQACVHLNHAVSQVYSITAKDIFIKDEHTQQPVCTQTEYYYGYQPKQRMGLVAGIIIAQLDEQKTSSNFEKIREQLESLKIKPTCNLFIHEFLFEGPPADVSYFYPERVHAYSDGFFLIGAEFDADGKMPQFIYP